MYGTKKNDMGAQGGRRKSHLVKNVHHLRSLSDYRKW